MMLQKHLLAWLLLSSAAAFWWPRWQAGWGTGFDPWLIVGPEGPSLVPRFALGHVVALTMFAIGGLLPRDEVVQVIRRWPAVLGGTAVQYLAMPLLAFLLATLFQLPRDLFIGVVLVGCVPGAMASNVLTLAARGNVSYSVSLTTAATLVSPLVVPLALTLALSAQTTIDVAEVSLRLLREVVGPVIAGHVLSRRWSWFARVMQSAGGPLANLSILWIISSVVALNRDRLAETTPAVVSVLLLLNVCGYMAGHLGGNLLKVSEGMRRALTIEVGMQNAGVGTALAIALFRDQPQTTIPTAAYTFGCMLTGTLLARWFARADAVDEGPPASAVATPADGDAD